MCMFGNVARCTRWLNGGSLGLAENSQNIVTRTANRKETHYLSFLEMWNGRSLFLSSQRFNCFHFFKNNISFFPSQTNGDLWKETTKAANWSENVGRQNGLVGGYDDYYRVLTKRRERGGRDDKNTGSLVREEGKTRGHTAAKAKPTTTCTPPGKVSWNKKQKSVLRKEALKNRRDLQFLRVPRPLTKETLPRKMLFRSWPKQRDDSRHSSQGLMTPTEMPPAKARGERSMH